MSTGYTMKRSASRSLPKKRQSYAEKLDQRRKDKLREKQFTELAQRMSPEQAREALARWAAAAGGKR